MPSRLPILERGGTLHAIAGPPAKERRLSDAARRTAERDRLFHRPACPVCGIASEQSVLRAKQVLTEACAAGRSSARSIGRTRRPGERLAASLRVLRCPACRYAGWDPISGGERQTTRTSARCAGSSWKRTPAGSVRWRTSRDLNGRGSEPERAIRLILTAIRIEMLPYPELWRRRELAGSTCGCAGSISTWAPRLARTAAIRIARLEDLCPNSEGLRAFSRARASAKRLAEIPLDEARPGRGPALPPEVYRRASRSRPGRGRPGRAPAGRAARMVSDPEARGSPPARRETASGIGEALKRQESLDRTHR